MEMPVPRWGGKEGTDLGWKEGLEQDFSWHCGAFVEMRKAPMLGWWRLEPAEWTGFQAPFPPFGRTSLCTIAGSSISQGLCFGTRTVCIQWDAYWASEYEFGVQGGREAAGVKGLSWEPSWLFYVYIYLCVCLCVTLYIRYALFTCSLSPPSLCKLEVSTSVFSTQLYSLTQLRA